MRQANVNLCRKSIFGNTWHRLIQLSNPSVSLFYFVSFCNHTVPNVDFAVKIQEVKAAEREDALFQCVLTAPMNELSWMFKNSQLPNNEKYEITVSEDKLIHKMIVRDCMPLDAGIYAAVAGIKSCNAWLIVDCEKIILFLRFLFMPPLNT